MTVRPVEAGSAPEVDQAVRGAQDKLLALARVAQVTGDPAGPMLEALAAQLDAEHRLFDDLKQTLREAGRPAAVFSDGQIDDIGRRLLGSCHAWSAGLIKASVWRSWAALAAIVLAAIVVGGVASWLAFGRPSNEQCHDERGGRWCGYWVTQPTEAAR